ncbi:MULTISPECIES: hypothetical protein [Rhizobium]|uniref:Lipoprotein n=1 Tax=Rhizobium wenxiniae TaxID=1737357 RepID=A0A7X0D1G2_9HYPH|nr:hypothetical protein [Rhizobium wenxiniae]MBB6163511.1 hypothetical protein [Rhizobium wenxiniae]
MSRNSIPIRSLFFAVLGAVQASCSVVDGGMASDEAGATKAPVVDAAAASSFKTRSYAFSSAKPVLIALKDEAPEDGDLKGASSYLGSAPYICTPSGFGRKAHCFLR